MHCVVHGDTNAELRQKLCIFARRIILSACMRGPALPCLSILIVAENAIHPPGHGDQLAGSTHWKISFSWSWLKVRHTHQMQVEGFAGTASSARLLSNSAKLRNCPWIISHAVSGRRGSVW